MTDVRGALRDKYARLVALREAAERGKSEPDGTLRGLAEAYPGALRELDRAPLSELRARLRLLSDEGPLPAWARPSFDFHRLLRLARSARLAAGRERDRDAAAQAIARGGEPPELVDAVLRPPGGRLTQWALWEVGRRHQLRPARAELLVFGHLRTAGG